MAVVRKRTERGQSCPSCATFGFDSNKPAWLYLMERPGEQQIGITNNMNERISYHGRFGWSSIETIGPYSGDVIQKLETSIKQWLKREVGTIPGTHENWFTAKLEVGSISQLLQLSQAGSQFIRNAQPSL